MHGFTLEAILGPLGAGGGAAESGGVAAAPRDEIDPVTVKIGRWVLRLGGGWREVETTGSSCADRPGARCWRVGPWPEPPGMQLEVADDRWRLVSDHASVATVFIREAAIVPEAAITGTARGAGAAGAAGAAGTAEAANAARPAPGTAPGEGVVVLSTRFPDVLPPGRPTIRAEAIEECVLLGHALGAGTLVEGVGRVPHGQAIEGDADGGLRRVADERSDPLAIPPDPDAFLQPPAGPALADPGDTCVELTGGLDSRLSLAFALAGGAPPGHACTFGPPGSPDVRIAAAIAGAFGVHHHRLDVGMDGADSIRHGGFHVLAAGGLLSLGKYAPLMAGLRAASDWRRAQMSGLGGELAIDFYAVVGIDRSTSAGDPRPVVRNRMIQVSPGLSPAVAPGIEAARRRIEAAVLARLEGGPGDVWDALRRFYVHERMANWAFVGLNANRHEYDLRLPLLSRPYLAWANALSTEQRRGRQGQEALIRQLAGFIPRGDTLTEVRTAAATRGLGKMIRAGRKYLAKAVLRRDPRADADNAAVLAAALDVPPLAEAIRDLGDLEVFGRRFDVPALRAACPRAGMLVGMHLSAAAILRAGDGGWTPARR